MPKCNKGTSRNAKISRAQLIADLASAEEEIRELVRERDELRELLIKAGGVPPLTDY